MHSAKSAAIIYRKAPISAHPAEHRYHLLPNSPITLSNRTALLRTILSRHLIIPIINRPKHRARCPIP